jgi:hypothetical protein
MTTNAKSDAVKWGALLVALGVQFAAAFMWAGNINARVDAVEKDAASIAGIATDVAVIKATLADVKASLDRAERKKL